MTMLDSVAMHLYFQKVRIHPYAMLSYKIVLSATPTHYGLGQLFTGLKHRKLYPYVAKQIRACGFACRVA